MQGTIGRLNGRLVVTWADPATGKRRRYRLAARTLAEAEAEARDVILRESARTAPLTVADLWAAFRADAEGRPVATNLAFTGRSVLPAFGALRPDQITVDDCRAYAARLRAEGIADGTIWTRLGNLRTVLNWAVKRGLIPRAPHIERPPQPAPRDRYLTRAEVDRLLAADAAPHVRLATILMLTTGCRVGAALELTWDRVDLGRGIVNLRAGEGGRKGRAVVPVNATLRAALTAAREATLSEYVVEWAGRPVGSIKRGFAAMVASAGLSDVTPHVLRHTAAVHMAEAGVSIDEIAQYLGHSSSRITAQVYARFSPTHLRQAAAVLEFGKVRQVR